MIGAIAGDVLGDGCGGEVRKPGDLLICTYSCTLKSTGECHD